MPSLSSIFSGSALASLKTLMGLALRRCLNSFRVSQSESDTTFARLALPSLIGTTIHSRSQVKPSPMPNKNLCEFKTQTIASLSRYDSMSSIKSNIVRLLVHPCHKVPSFLFWLLILFSRFSFAFAKACRGLRLSASSTVNKPSTSQEACQSMPCRANAGDMSSTTRHPT